MDWNFGDELCFKRTYTNNYSDSTKTKKRRRVRFAKEIIEEQVRIIRERFGFSHGGKKKYKRRKS